MNSYEYYKENYYKQLERSRDFAQRINYLYAVIFVLGGSLFYLIKTIDLSNLSILRTIFGILLGISSYFLLINSKNENNKTKFVNLAILSVTLVYVIYSAVSEQSGNLEIIQVIILVTSVSLLLSMLYFLVRVIYNYDYSYIPPSNKLELYRMKLIKSSMDKDKDSNEEND